MDASLTSPSTYDFKVVLYHDKKETERVTDNSLQEYTKHFL